MVTHVRYEKNGLVSILFLLKRSLAFLTTTLGDDEGAVSEKINRMDLLHARR